MNISETSDSSYKTATDILMFYINHSNLESAYFLMKEGEVNLEIKNHIGMTPLHVNQPQFYITISKLLN
jgi:hypothetical protein